MVEKKKTTGKTTKKSAGNKKTSGVLTAEEKAALRATARERKLEGNKAAQEKAVLEAIAAMPKADRTMAERLHKLIKASAPDLAPKTWYGMPAYAKDDKVVCFFQAADKFKARYATLGFSDTANLDQGDMWPTSFALKKLSAADEAKIAKLVKKAVT